MKQTVQMMIVTISVSVSPKGFRVGEEPLPWGDGFEKQIMNDRTLGCIGWYFE